MREVKVGIFGSNQNKVNRKIISLPSGGFRLKFNSDKPGPVFNTFAIAYERFRQNEDLHYCRTTILHAITSPYIITKNTVNSEKDSVSCILEISATSGVEVTFNSVNIFGVMHYPEQEVSVFETEDFRKNGRIKANAIETFTDLDIIINGPKVIKSKTKSLIIFMKTAMFDIEYVGFTIPETNYYWIWCVLSVLVITIVIILAVYYGKCLFCDIDKDEI